MFAAKRNDRVIGRTTILVVSIIIKNGFSQLGAPSGSKWAREAFVSFVYDDRIKDIHIGNPNLIVKIRWLDKLNLYGFKPNKLIKIIDEKIIVINDIEPFNEFL